jgi:diadenosine tetraphosphate (Ap4A) HIT family hydrolase
MPGAISARVARIEAGRDPQLIARMGSGYAILANQQPLDGCCMLLPRPVVGQANDLDPSARALFMTDLLRLGDAVLAATGAERINYLILCNQVPELHGHVVPRYAGEDADKRLMDPFAAYDFGGARHADPGGRDARLLAALRASLA